MRIVYQDLEQASGQRASIWLFVRRWLYDTGFKAVALHRLAHWLHVRRVKYLPSLVAAYGVRCAGADIRPEAQLGPGFVIKHSPGIVIGGGVITGSNCTILQNVTLGEKLGKEGGHGYPRLGDGVVIAAGAVLLGPIVVGSGAVVGANAVVLHDVEPSAVVGGVPARRLR